MSANNDKTPVDAQPAVKPEPPARSRAELTRDIAANREAIAAALDAIETKLNLPKQARLATERLTNKLRVLRDENPVALAAGIAVAAVAVGAAVTLGIRLATRR